MQTMKNALGVLLFFLYGGETYRDTGDTHKAGGKYYE